MSHPVLPTVLPTVLVADIGGTNTRVALVHHGKLDHASIRRTANAGQPSLGPILAAYLQDEGVARVDGASVAAAGPVTDGVAELTNLDWRITPDEVRQATGAAHVAILNDLQAQGHALDHLAPDAFRPVLPGAGTPRRGARLVIGVGTGFNAAPVHRTRAGLYVAPSECGHASLPVQGREEAAMATEIARAHGFAGVEDVLSGRGLERLAALCSGGPQRPAAEVMAALAAGEANAVRTGRLFQTLLGRVVGDLALTHLPFQGIFLIGGVARAFTPYLTDGAFAAAFRDKGRFSAFMDDFAVHLVEDDYAALAGCAAYLNQEKRHD